MTEQGQERNLGRDTDSSRGFLNRAVALTSCQMFSKYVEHVTDPQQQGPRTFVY